jgi:hypothetical protein
MLFNFLVNQQLINDNKEEFLSYEKCKEFLLGIGWTARGDFKESIFSKTKRRLENFREWLGNQYRHSQFEDIKKWVENVSRYVEDNLANRLIFSELYTLNTEEFINRIEGLIEDIGIPMLFNNKEECVSMLSKNYDAKQFFHFYVLLKFMEYINSKNCFCPIALYCHNNNSDIFERHICLENPLASVDRDDICPFADFLNSYGFDKVTFK